MMITAILSLLGSSAVGSLIGGVFAFMNRKADMEAKRVELDHDKAKWAHELELRKSDMEMAKVEAQGRLDVAVVESDAAVDTARMQAIAQISESEKVSAEEIKAAGKLGWMFVFSSVLNKLIRPVLTVGLAAAALFLNWMVIHKLTDSWTTLTPAQQFETGMQAFAWVTAQSSMAFSYWFVSRGTSKK